MRKVETFNGNTCHAINVGRYMDFQFTFENHLEEETNQIL